MALYNGMLYPCAILFTPSSIPEPHLSGFLKFVAKYAVVAWAPENRLESSNPHYRSARTDSEYLMSDDCSVIWNVPWSILITLKLTRRVCQKLLRETEKTIQLLIIFVSIFTRPGSSVCHPLANTLTTAITALSKSRCCTSFELDPACFSTVLVEVTILI